MARKQASRLADRRVPTHKRCLRTFSGRYLEHVVAMVHELYKLGTKVLVPPETEEETSDLGRHILACVSEIEEMVDELPYAADMYLREGYLPKRMRHLAEMGRNTEPFELE